MSKWLCSFFVLIMASGVIPVSQANESRYISIRNTDSVWIPGNVCALQFRLDNGGSGEGFKHLEITLRLKDSAGKVLSEGVMSVEPFGDSDATRSQNGFMESECQETATQVDVVAATEEVDGLKQPLALSVFDPQYYKPLSVSVHGK